LNELLIKSSERESIVYSYT